MSVEKKWLRIRGAKLLPNELHILNQHLVIFNVAAPSGRASVPAQIHCANTITARHEMAGDMEITGRMLAHTVQKQNTPAHDRIFLRRNATQKQGGAIRCTKPLFFKGKSRNFHRNQCSVIDRNGLYLARLFIHSGMHFPRKRDTAFTLIELLVVIAILAILMSLLIPVTTSVKNTARKTQALNDIKQITTAVKAYYTEYSKYPLDTADQGHDYTFTQTSNQDNLMDVLRASGRSGSWDATTGENLNPRRQVFLSANYTKNLTNPAGGIVPTNATKFQNQYVDPWGMPYNIRVDGNYDNVVANPYATNAGPASLTIDVIGWSFGIDKASTSNVQPKDPTTGSGDLKVGTAADDVVSWQ